MLADELRDDAGAAVAPSASRTPISDRPQRDGVGDDRVDADRREQQQQRPEHREHPRRNAAEDQVRLDVIGQRPHVE